MPDWLIKFRKDKTALFSSKKETQTKSNIIKYISSNSILQCNLIEGPFIDKVTDALSDLWGVTTKILVHWGVRNKNLKANGGAKAKKMCLKEQ